MEFLPLDNGVLSVSFLVMTVPDRDAHRRFAAFELRIVRVIRGQRPLEHTLNLKLIHFITKHRGSYLNVRLSQAERHFFVLTHAKVHVGPALAGVRRKSKVINQISFNMNTGPRSQLQKNFENEGEKYR